MHLPRRVLSANFMIPRVERAGVLGANFRRVAEQVWK